MLERRAIDELHLSVPVPELLDVFELVSDGVYITDLERRILCWNSGAARISGFQAKDVIQTLCYDSVLMHVDAAGARLCHIMCPLHQTMTDGTSREARVYLHHRDGHRVPVLVRTAALRNEAGVVVAGIETFSYSGSVAALRQRVNQLETESLVDALTGLPNRRYVERAIDQSVASFNRHGHSFGLLFADIDHFKLVNDRHGHEAGDKVLQMVAATLSGSTRASDVLGRWGGEEFILVAGGVSLEALIMAAQRARHLVQQSWLMIGDTRVAVTVSIGATLAWAGDTSESVVARADSLMYVSKERGRNKVSWDTDKAAQG